MGNGSHLCGERLISTLPEQELDDGIMIFLGSHVEGCETILGLGIDGGASLYQ